MSEVPQEVPMPSTNEFAQQFAYVLEMIELAETGHQPAIDFCLMFLKQTVVSSVKVLDEPEIQSIVKKVVKNETGITVTDRLPEG